VYAQLTRKKIKFYRTGSKIAEQGLDIPSIIPLIN